MNRVQLLPLVVVAAVVAQVACSSSSTGGGGGSDGGGGGAHDSGGGGTHDSGGGGHPGSSGSGSSTGSGSGAGDAGLIQCSYVNAVGACAWIIGGAACSSPYTEGPCATADLIGCCVNPTPAPETAICYDTGTAAATLDGTSAKCLEGGGSAEWQTTLP